MRYTDLIFDLYGTRVDIYTEENDLVWEKTALLPEKPPTILNLKAMTGPLWKQ